MTDVEVAIAAVVAGLAAALAWDVPWWWAAIAGVAALVARRPWLAIVALALVASNRADAATAPLDGARHGPVDGVEVTVLSDPTVRFGRWQFEVALPVGHAAADLGVDRPEPVVGERLVVSGTTTAMPQSAWARSRHLASRLRVDDVAVRHRPALPFRVANAARDRLVAGADSLDDRLPLYAGLLLGDDRDQDAATRHRFRASGLAHLLAVSGQNVAFVLVACAPLLGIGSLRWRWIATAGLLVAFTLVTRWEPSVLRAVAMAGVAATAHLQGRYASGVRRVAVAVIVLVLADPLLVWSDGFRLSIAASAALVLLQRPIARRLPGPRWLADPLATVLAAQVGTTPILIGMGVSVPLASIPANLLAVPVAGWAMVWGLTAGAVAALGGPVADVLHAPTGWMLAWVDGVARVAASPRWPAVGAATWAILAVGVGAAVAAPRRWIRRGAAAIVIAAVASTLVPSSPAGAWTPLPGLRILRGPDRAVVVVAGGQVDAVRMLDQLSRQRIAAVDLAVFTSDTGASTALAATLRDAFPVVTVLAPPGRVRDAAELRPGPVRVGSLRLDVGRVEGRWAVDGPV